MMIKKTINWIAFARNFSLFSLNKLKIKPATIGRIIIFRISSIMLQKLTSIYCPPSIFIRNGVTKGEINVEIAPMVTAKTRLACAMYDITLEANPLGTQPIRIIPAAISGGKLNMREMPKATNGMIR